MRILQISSAKTFGGGEKHFVDLCKGLHDRGHDVFVVLRPTSEWHDRLSFLPKENFIYVSIRNSFGVFSAQKIAGFIRKKDIEIVHAHMARDYLPISLACRIAKTSKFIFTRHVLFPMKSFYKFALTNLSKAIAVSKGVETNLRMLFPKEKVTVINNGIDVEKWLSIDRTKLRKEFRFENNIPADARLIGTVGELKPLKGQEDFVLAAQIVAARFPETYFAVIGKDNSFDQAYRRKLKRLVKIFGLGERFLWLDWVEDTGALLSALDIFVSPSHSESFGLAILEAMTSAVPVVSTETEGAKELFKAEGAGKLVPAENPAKLAEAIIEILENEDFGKTLGRNAQIIARENFSVEKMIAETEEVYREVLRQ